MAKAGMHAILVTFPNMKDFEMIPGQLYNLTLVSKNGEHIESLYFSAKPGEGEVMLFKWQDDGLARMTTVMGGSQKFLKSIELDGGDEFLVEDVYHIREAVNAAPERIIEVIKEDIRELERNVNIRCEATGCQRVGHEKVEARTSRAEDQRVAVSVE